jgi:hypothetical protein
LACAARLEAHYSIHRSKNGLPFFLSSIPSSFRTQEKLGEPLEAWEHIAGNTYYCCMGCFTVVVVSTLSCAILTRVSFLESLRLYQLLKLFLTNVLVPEPNDAELFYLVKTYSHAQGPNFYLHIEGEIITNISFY